MGRTTPMIDTDVLDEVIRYGFPELLYIARWENEDSLDVAIRERLPAVGLVYTAALHSRRDARVPRDSHGQEILF